MWVLVGAVFTASILGSLHCVGMCGPLALWAGGAGDAVKKSQAFSASSLYHLGRLLTYAIVGGMAGAIGSIVDLGASTLGFQLAAARIAGGLMIFAGGIQLARMIRQRRLSQTKTAHIQAQPLKPSLVTRMLVKFRPYVFRLPLAVRGLTVGLLTALLPCGWLYLFALLAAGTGNVVSGSVVMAAFWLGSVPALVGLVAGTHSLALRFRQVIPAFAALLLIAGGCFTASGRGFTDLNALTEIQVRAASSLDGLSKAANGSNEDAEISADLHSLTETPLPCCSHTQQASDETLPR